MELRIEKIAIAQSLTNTFSQLFIKVMDETKLKQGLNEVKLMD